MRTAAAGLALLGVVLVAGCVSHAPSQGPVTENGWTRYTESRVKGSYPCPDNPVLLEGNRTDIRLTGACSKVRVAGNHNDIHVDVAPGGTIEITGAHNDVTWRQVGSGPRPELQNLGASNDFHHDES